MSSRGSQSLYNVPLYMYIPLALFPPSNVLKQFFFLGLKASGKFLRALHAFSLKSLPPKKKRLLVPPLSYICLWGFTCAVWVYNKEYMNRRGTPVSLLSMDSQCPSYATNSNALTFSSFSYKLWPPQGGTDTGKWYMQPWNPLFTPGFPKPVEA